MLQLWLVRHGETVWSRSGQHTSLTDLPLTDDGAAQARGLGARLGAQDFDAVLTSPLRRARDTAALAGFAHASVVDDLVEWRYGPGEGLTTPQIQQHVPHWRIWTHGAPEFDPAGIVVDGPHEAFRGPGEARGQVAARLHAFIATMQRSGHHKVLCFAHGHILRALGALWCDMPIQYGWHFPLTTGAVSVLGHEKETPALVRWNS